MAYDYDVDILAGLWTGAEDAEEPYASFIAANPTLTDEVSENRILSTIELLRSHMELLQTRDEAKLLHESISKLFRHTAGGSNPWSEAAAVTTAVGNVPGPTFPAGASFDITIDGVTSSPASASGGDCATVAAELNITLDATLPGLTEQTTVDTTGATSAGLSGTYFTINSAGDSTPYYVWFDFPGVAEAFTVTPNGDTDGNLGETFFRFFLPDTTDHYCWMSHDGAAEISSITAIADVGGALGGKYFTISSAGDATDYYCWIDHAAAAEVSTVTTIADVGGALGGKYFTLNSATDAVSYYVWMDHAGVAERTTVTAIADTGGDLSATYFSLNNANDVTAYYVWMSQPGLAEVSTVTTAADTGGDLGGTSFDINSAGDATSYYVWLSHPGVAEVSTVVPTADTGGSLGGLYFDLNSAGDATSYYVWLSHPATAGFADAAVATAPAGSVVPGIAAATYDFDVTINGGANQPLTITTTGGEDYDAIAAFMSAVPVAGGTVAFTGGAFRVTSSTTGAASAATITTGSTGSGGGDLFGAITTATSNAVTFPAATGGIAAASDPTPGGTALAAIYAVGDTAATIGAAIASVVGGNVNFGASGTTTVTITNAAVGDTTDIADGDTSFGFATTVQGVDVASDPAPGGTAIAAVYAVGDTAGTIGASIAAAVGALGDFGASGTTVVTITNAVVGDTTDSSDNDTGFAIATTVDGVDASVDPSGTGTGIEVVYALNDTASTIGGLLRTAIDGVVGFGTGGAGAECTITNAGSGPSTDAADVDSGFGIVVDSQGLAAATDPTPGGGLVAIGVGYSVGDSATAIGAAIAVDVGTLGAFGASDSEGVATITNAVVGATTDTADVDTGFAIATTTQGIAAPSDPAPGILTSITATIAVNATAGAVATAVAAALGGNADFGAGGGNPFLVTNAAVGVTTDSADVDTGFTVAASTQGVDVAETDPPAAEGTGHEVAYTVGATAATLGGLIATAIGGVAGIGAEGSDPVVATMDSVGIASDAVDVDTGFAIAVTIQGSDASVDPAPGGLTGIPIAVAAGLGDSEIGSLIRAGVGANADFFSEGVGNSSELNAVAADDTTDSADVDSGLGISTTRQGSAASGDAVAVQAFCEQPGPRLGIRGQEDFVTFVIANGTGGIIGPAGIIPGERSSKPKKVSDQGRDLALGNFRGAIRPNPLTP